MTRATFRGKSLPTPLIVAVIIGCLLAAGGVRSWAMERRSTGQVAQVAQLDSYTLGLLLGGLRGPLVMSLWSGVESDRVSRRYDDLNSKIELIRLLQPQFDAVHEFQVWNKAYNLSASMATLPGKYAMILDAIRYAEELNRERPNQLSTKSALGRTYGQKLGGSNEAVYYDVRLRDETLPRETRVIFTFPEDRRRAFVEAARGVGLKASALTFRPTAREGRSDLLAVGVRERYAEGISRNFAGDDVTQTRRLDDDTNATLTAIRHQVIVDDAGNLIDEGQAAELEYLQDFQPFPYGVGAHALAYDYGRQALDIQLQGSQRHPSLSPRVISRDVPLALWKWSERAWQRGRLAEAEALDRRLPDDPIDFDLVTQEWAIDAPQPLSPLLLEAVWSYDRAAELTRRARQAFAEHIERFPQDAVTYDSHTRWLASLEALCKADADYIRLSAETDPAERQRLAREAQLNYALFRVLVGQQLARFFMTDDVLQELGLTPGEVDPDALDIPTSLRAVELSLQTAQTRQLGYEYVNEAIEFGTYTNRAAARLRQIGESGLVE